MGNQEKVLVLHRSVIYNKSHNFKANTECICARYGVQVDVLEVGVSNWVFWQTREFKIVLKGMLETIRVIEEII